MKYHFLYILLIAILLTGCSKDGNQTSLNSDVFVAQIISKYPQFKNKQYEFATIKRIVDGDTYETNSGHKIRLIGVNTPEVFGETQYYGREASDFSKKRLENQTVYLFRDVSETDRYGRVLRYLFIQNDPVMFNETLLNEGYANTMSVPPDVMFAKKFVVLERQARENRIGIWEKSDAQACKKPEIKGNINTQKDKIYHLPGGKYYDQTKAEEVFCTEAEAIDAGYRKSSQ
ncbi:thermonuclease family protein [Paenibacillus sp. FSL H7-0331]|nr:thermonuclease family protein [Paenibacillus sp. FSL H7-0331]OMF14517.1 hypothetical protein BK127_17495 [Paenibacillus sp. FSL H7-0331]